MKQRAHGFTLIELMTAILVLGIMLGFAIPSFREMTRNNRVAGAQNDFITALAIARNEALHRSRTVSICASADGASCGTKDDWAKGWIVFTDGDDLGEVDGTDEVLQKWGAVAGETTLNAADAFLTYAPTGMQTPVTTKTFKVYSQGCSGSKARSVSIGPIGSVTSTTTTCS